MGGTGITTTVYKPRISVSPNRGSNPGKLSEGAERFATV
jgi:hypothetical protein